MQTARNSTTRAINFRENKTLPSADTAKVLKTESHERPRSTAGYDHEKGTERPREQNRTGMLAAGNPLLEKILIKMEYNGKR